MRVEQNVDPKDPAVQRGTTGKEVTKQEEPKPPSKLLEGPEKRAEVKSLSQGQGKGQGKGQGADLRNFTPREMAELSMDLYVSGVVTWDEYALLAFQPELHPDYDRTVGALTGEKAAPDRPRDFIAEWEERLRFEEEHNGKDRQRVSRTMRILSVLKQMNSPTNVVV